MTKWHDEKVYWDGIVSEGVDSGVLLKGRVGTDNVLIIRIGM